MLQFSVLSSGSKANCLLVQAGDTRVLVDCGLSARETERRLKLHGIAPESITAIVVTHEHRDHVAGIPVFGRKHQTRVYANGATFRNSELLEQIPIDCRQLIHSGREFFIDNLCFHPFSIVHDAMDPMAFRISDGERTLGVVTDLGHVTNLVRERSRNLDALVLESNHDPVLLEQCAYPWLVKQRIAGRSGHLSNGCAATFLGELREESDRPLRYVVAAHISENSNKPELALETLRGGWGNGFEPSFFAATPYAALPMITL